VNLDCAEIEALEVGQRRRGLCSVGADVTLVKILQFRHVSGVTGELDEFPEHVLLNDEREGFHADRQLLEYLRIPVVVWHLVRTHVQRGRRLGV